MVFQNLEKDFIPIVMHTTVTSHTYIHDKTLEGSGKEKEGKTSPQNVEIHKVKSSCESLKKEEKSPGEKLIEAKECKICEKQFRVPSIYIHHYQETHGGLPPEYIDKNLFFCEKCPRAFLSKTQLTDHIYKFHFLKENKSQEEKLIEAKGQLISICLFGAFVSTKKPTKFFSRISALLYISYY